MHPLEPGPEGPAGAWVDAYLHRKEGDSSNAAYWYQRAGQPPQRGSLQEEWLSIAEALLGWSKQSGCIAVSDGVTS
jgi:hypothetical protein